MAQHGRTELAELVAAVRAHLEVEVELGNDGLALPEVHASAPASAAALHTVDAQAPAVVAARQQPGEPADKLRRLEQLAVEAGVCTACVLHEKRKQSVFARGSANAELVFVGEGPGFEEDQQGLPFVGPAGQLLDRMIGAMGFGREEIYVCNIVKCRPPENRTPRPEEATACSRFLLPQLELVAPKVIVALGRCAAENLGVAQAAGSWRGRWGQWHGLPVMPTYHPAYLLRSPEHKRVV